MGGVSGGCLKINSGQGQVHVIQTTQIIYFEMFIFL